MERIYLTGGEAEIDSRGWKIRWRDRNENGGEYREEDGARSRRKKKNKRRTSANKVGTERRGLKKRQRWKEIRAEKALNTDLMKDKQINHSSLIATWLTWSTCKNITRSLIMHLYWADLHFSRVSLPPHLRPSQLKALWEWGQLNPHIYWWNYRCSICSRPLWLISHPPCRADQCIFSYTDLASKRSLTQQRLFCQK